MVNGTQYGTRETLEQFGTVHGITILESVLDFLVHNPTHNSESSESVICVTTRALQSTNHNALCLY